MIRSRVGHPRWPRLRVGSKFFVAVGVLVLAVLGLAVVAEVALTQTKHHSDQLYSGHLRTTHATADLANALDDVAMTAVLRTQARLPARQATLDARLDVVLIPLVNRTLARLQTLDSHDVVELRKMAQIEAGFAQYLRLPRTDASDPTPTTQTAAVFGALPERISAIFLQINQLADELSADEQKLAAENKRAADRNYRTSQLALGGGVAVSMLLGLLVALLLSRDMVPRIRRYAQFATRVAAGQSNDVLRTSGRDELTDLGRALNSMVVQRELRQGQDLSQAEFVDTLQVSSTEEEAHELIQHHLQRSLPDSTALVLQRNNSANQLRAATTLDPDSDIAARLVSADPRSCLALRFAQTHREGPGLKPLLSCSLCVDRDVSSTCEPLLVGGEVIGSVLVSCAQPPDEPAAARIKTSVAQAAPVLANLRNLALAEFRANNDALSGLPNKRATDDTLKRMVAQASRSLAPLSAMMLDLDHFKQINDRFGHDKGDEVLAAVGAALASSLRAGDFAGRFGGEEFLILLPDTSVDDAAHVAEKIRARIASISVLGVERDITASLGVAGLLVHAGNATGLLREADRALYAAKAAGRNQVVSASVLDPDPAGPALLRG